MAALHNGLRESARALLAVGADLNSAADSGLTPLLIAVRNGDLPSAEALLDAGADPNRAMSANAPYAYGHSPLVRAAGDGNLALIQLLLERGAEIDGRDGAGRTALLAACARPSGNVLFWKEIREDHGLKDGSSGNFLPENLWRSENQEPINEKRPLLDFFGKNPICDEEWLSIVRLLLEREADVEAETPPRRDGASFSMEVSGTPLLQAACRGSLATVNLLLDAGATPRPAAGSTPLHAAISWGDDLAVVQRLLEAGASVAERDAEGISPSGIAVRQGNIEALISLEAAGADLLATKSEFGATLLHLAASHGQTEMVRFLLDYGFQIEATCALKSPAEREADRQKLRELSASVLPDALPAPETVKSNVRPTGVTPLMLAAAANKPATVVLLLERGADPKARDSEGKTARDYARRSEETEARKRENSCHSCAQRRDAGDRRYDCEDAHHRVERNVEKAAGGHGARILRHDEPPLRSGPRYARSHARPTPRVNRSPGNLWVLGAGGQARYDGRVTNEETGRFLEALLKDACAALEIPLTDEQAALCARHAALVLETNAHTNLTRITEPEAMALKHYADSLTALIAVSDLKPGASVCDVGTGAGYPGVPLKIVRPDIKLTLLDSLNKRVRFNQEAAKLWGWRT